MATLPLPRKVTPTAKSSKPPRFYADNTILSGYKKCPRFHYLRQERGWRSEGIRKPLVFGIAWHAAMAVVWQGFHKLGKNLLPVAMEAFWQSWIEEGAPKTLDLATIEEWGARTPHVAEEMLINYVHERESILKKSRLISSEQPFAVPIFPDDTSVWYIGRKDEKILLNGEGLVIEHKTTSEYKKDGGFKSSYIEGWSPNAQIEGYLYSEQHEKKNRARMVWVDAALVHKQVHDKFKFIPISIATGGIEAWLWECRDWIARIMSERERLATADTNASHMTAFPKNTESCSGKYGLCEFIHLCRSVNNPHKLKVPPEGFVEDRWEPFDILKLNTIMEK